MAAHPFEHWLHCSHSAVGRHSLRVITERDGSRLGILDSLRELVRGHYVDPETTAQRMASLGAPKTAELLREHLPTQKTARSGDLGEMLATEVAEQELRYRVPIRRLRWKDGREMALRGDDIIGMAHDGDEKLHILKGESKSRGSLSRVVLEEAGEALDRNRGRPTRHSVLFVAERLRDFGEHELAKELEEAVLTSFHGVPIAHMLFVLSAGPLENLLVAHLEGAAKRKRIRHAVGIRIRDHADFIALLYGGL